MTFNGEDHFTWAVRQLSRLSTNGELVDLALIKWASQQKAESGGR
jgi:hypothetical protein